MKGARLVDLNERDLDVEPLAPDEDNAVTFPMKGCEICTVKLSV